MCVLVCMCLRACVGVVCAHPLGASLADRCGMCKEQPGKNSAQLNPLLSLQRTQDSNMYVIDPGSILQLLPFV